MTKTTKMSHPRKRSLLALLAILPWIGGCGAASEAPKVAKGDQSPDRFQDIGLILVADAIEGAKMEGVKFYNDADVEIYGKSILHRRNREILSFGGAQIPKTVRVIWRENPTPVWGKQGGIDYEGKIIGDYTIPVAERIPDNVLNYLRKNKGVLRLKFRLKPDGVLFGWDIERGLPIPGCKPGEAATCNATHFFMPGGDFLDTKY